MSEATKWNFDPCEAERGTGVVLDSPQFPQFWARVAGLIGSRVPVVKIKQNDREFFIANFDNEGWKKVTIGQGGPNFSHHDLDVEKYVPDEVG